MARAMIDGLYTVYNAHSNKPEIIVLTLLAALSAHGDTKASSSSPCDADKEGDMSDVYASVERMAASHAAPWAILVTTASVETALLPLPSRVCRVMCATGPSSTSSILLPADCHTAWAALLRDTNETIQSPQSLVTLLTCHCELWLAPLDLARLHAECVWLGEHRCVAALLPLLAMAPSMPYNKPAQFGVEFSWHVEALRGGEAMFNADLRLLGAEPVATVASSSLSVSSSLPPPMRLVILHPYNTRTAWRQIARLLGCLSARDCACVCIAGEIVIPISDGPDAQRQMCVEQCERLEVSSSSSVREMRRMWELAADATSQWHREDLLSRSCDTAIGRSGTEEEEYSDSERLRQAGAIADEDNVRHRPRIAVIFFLPDDCSIIKKASVMSVVRRNPAFFHVPVVCLATSMHIANTHVLLDLCKLTHGRVLFAQEGTDIKDDANPDITEQNLSSLQHYSAMVGAALEFIAGLTHYDTSLLILSSRKDLDERWGPLHVSDTFGVEQVFFPRESRSSGTQQLLGPLTTRSGAWVYFRRAWKGRRNEKLPDLSTGGIERTVLSAYNIDAGEYEIVYDWQNEKSLPIVAPDARDWWWCLLCAFQLLCEERPDALDHITKNTISRTWFYFGAIDDLEGTEYYQREVQPLLNALEPLLPREYRRREFLIVMWILSHLYLPHQPSNDTQSQGSKRGGKCLSNVTDIKGSSFHSDDTKKSAFLIRDAPSSVRMNPFIVNYRVTNFTDTETSFSTLQAIITRTCPYPDDAGEHTTSTTLELKNLSGDSAWVDVKSVNHIPSLTHAVERAVMLFRVDLTTSRMKFDRRVPDGQLTTPEISEIEVSNLLPSQRYCLVHLALRRPTECWVSVSDILVADGIVFKTLPMHVNELCVASVSHNTVELVWKEEGDGNGIKAVRFKLCPFRWMNQPPDLTNDDGGIVEVNHRYGTRCVVTQLQPCTLYHVTAVPICPGHGDMSEWESYGTVTELYAATCMMPEEGDLTIQWTPQGNDKVHLLISYPIHHATAYISPSCGVRLCILPRISIDISNSAEDLVSSTQGEYETHKADSHVYLSHTTRLSESHLVNVYFEITLHTTKRPLKGLHSESPVRSEGFSVQIGPFHLTDGIRIANVTSTSAQLQWDIGRTSSSGPLTVLVQPLYGATRDARPSQPASMPSCGDMSEYIIEGLTPSFRYEALLRRKSGIGNIARVEFSTPPLPPSRSVASVIMDTAKRKLYVSLLPRNPDDERFLAATIVPFMERVDNLTMNGFLCTSYQELQPGQPLVLSIVDSWVSRDGDLVRSAPTYLYAVTDIACTVCPNGHLKLTWTCAARGAQTLRGGEGGGERITHAATFAAPSPLSGIVTEPNDSINSKRTDDSTPFTGGDGVFLDVFMDDIVRARNPSSTICLEPPSSRISKPIHLSFRGPDIIEEASPVFILPPLPSITADVCQLKGQENGLLHVCLAFTFIRLLRDTLDSLSPFVSAALVSNSGKEIRLPLEDIEQEELQFFIPIASSELPTIVVVRLYLDNINQMGDSYEAFNIPVILTPWSLVSEPFEIHGAVNRPMAKPIVDFRVTALFPTFVELEWTSLEDDNAHDKTGEYMCVTVQCALEGSDNTKCVKTLFCFTSQLLIDNLTPATPYIISAGRRNECDNSASLNLVTPFDVTNDSLQELLGSLLLQQSNDNHESNLINGRIRSMSSRVQKDSLQLLIPRSRKKLIKISPYCNRYTGNESDSFDNSIPLQFTLRASFCVDLVSASGEVIQEWSCLDELRGHEISYFFTAEMSKREALLPHLTVRAFSHLWMESPMRSHGEGLLTTASDFNGESEMIVDIIGYPCLSYIAENCFIVEWKGSCEAYHVRWRTGLSPVIHFETVTCGLNQKPRLKIDTTYTDIDVFLFSVYGVDHPSNCLAFCVLVPPKPRCIPLFYLPTGGGLARLPSVNRSDLLEILWSINIGGQTREALCVVCNPSEIDTYDMIEVEVTEEELCAEPSFVVTARITDTSFVGWEEAFADIFRHPTDHCAMSLPLQIAWLNPTVSVCFPIDM